MDKTGMRELRRIIYLLIGAAALVVVTMPLATNACAAEWRIEPLFRVAGEVDDNATLDIRADQEPEIEGYVLEGSARFGYSSPVTEFHATPRLLRRDYGEPDFDTDDQFFSFDYDREFRSANFRIRGSYGRELVRTGERVDADLDLEDPDEVPIDDSGRVTIRDRRERVEIVPRYSFQLSNISSLGIDLNLLDVQYDENAQGLLNDYFSLRGNVNFRRSWSRRSTAILAATFRQYEPDDTEAVNGYGISAGFENRLSETTRFRFLVGVENTELDTGEDDVNPVANVYITRRLETITMFAQYRRVISGGGGGSLTARDMLNLNFTRRLNDKISAGIGVRAYTTNALEEGTVTIDERDYLQLRGQFTWNLTRTVSLEADYRYTILNRELVGESANSNNIMIWLSWRPTPFVASQ